MPLAGSTTTNADNDSVMSLNAMESAEETCTCPTCGARQVPAPECRRCKCDLGLLFRVLEQNAALRRQCLLRIRERRLIAATRLARRCCEMSATLANRRLLATCYLLQGDFHSALRIRQST
jgi:hypothetical protein